LPGSKWIKSPIGVYFLSLLVANVLSSVGYTMSLKWAHTGAVRTGRYCTAQAAIKQLGNLSSALWAIAIALHVFITIFWERKCRRFVAPTVVVVVWVLIFFMVVIISPVGIAKDKMGPWWGVEPFWCGIAANYWAEGFLVEYLPVCIASP
jgi:FtsH-binding integral membrane protein